MDDLRCILPILTHVQTFAGPSIQKSASYCSLHFIITLTELRHDEVRQIGHCRVLEHDLEKLKGLRVSYKNEQHNSERAKMKNVFDPHSLMQFDSAMFESQLNNTKIPWIPSANHRRRPVNGPYGSYQLNLGKKSQEPQLVWTVYDGIHQCPIKAWKYFLQNCSFWCSISWYFLHQQHVMGVHMKHCWSFLSKWWELCQKSGWEPVQDLFTVEYSNWQLVFQSWMSLPAVFVRQLACTSINEFQRPQKIRHEWTHWKTGYRNKGFAAPDRMAWHLVTFGICPKRSSKNRQNPSHCTRFLISTARESKPSIKGTEKSESGSPAFGTSSHWNVCNNTMISIWNHLIIISTSKRIFYSKTFSIINLKKCPRLTCQSRTQLMANCLFGLLRWNPGIPLWRDYYLAVPWSNPH